MSEFDKKRAAEKQASRDEDQRRLSAGEVTPEQLQKENSFTAGFHKGKLKFPEIKVKYVDCKDCNAQYPSDKPHTKYECVREQLENSKDEIVQLKKSLASWQDAWYNQRAAGVKLYWEIPHIAYMTRTEKDKLLSAARTIQETDEVQKLERRLPIDSE